MGEFKHIVTPLYQATKRDYLHRMQDDKVHCTKVAKEYEADYWDGDRRYGYGGYRYMVGRWEPVAETLIKDYGLTAGSKVLDVGCGKGFLLYEMLQIEPGLVVAGFDMSKHGLENAKEEVKPYLFSYKAQNPLPYGDNEFDLVISLGTLHNLKIFELKSALKEVERVGKQGYIMLESYRNEEELFNLQCWALTAESFFDVSEWIWLYRHFGYSGDYEFIFLSKAQ